MTRVAVVGAGSVGAFFAAHLSGTEHEVIACVRRPFAEYRIESKHAPFTGPATTITDPEHWPHTEAPDWVFVGVKAHQTADASPWFDQLCSEATTVVALQNGVEAVDRLGPLVHGANVVPTVVYCGTELVAPGHVKHRQGARLIVPEQPEGHALQALYSGAAIEIEPSEDYVRAAWVKLGINSVANGLTALTGRPMEVIAEPNIAAVAEKLLTECWAVANAEGAGLDLDRVPDSVRSFGELTGSRPSMLQDRQAGRTTEHDAIHGAIIRKGRAHGIPTPTTEVVHNLLGATAPLE